jgi:hypothetical protein
MKTFFMRLKLRKFTDDELVAALDMIGSVDRAKLNDERIWKDAQEKSLAIAGELLRRKVIFW